MSWAKLDDGLDEHPKVEQLLEGHIELGMLDGDAMQELAGLAALGLWTLGLTNTSRRLTEGHLSKRVLRGLAPATHQLLADRLTEVGLLDHESGGVQIHDYLDHNPSKDDVIAQRAARSEAGRKGGQRSGQTRRQAKAEASAEASASANGKQKRTPARTRTPIQPPIPPKGGRARDRQAFEHELAAWTEQHLPGANPKRVAALAERLRGRVPDLTADVLAAYAAENPVWALHDEDFGANGAGA